MPVTPNLLLKANMYGPQDYAYWEENDNTSDPFYGYPYRWKVNLIVQPQAHSSHVTTFAMYYTGDDIRVGDWYATGVAGRALQVCEILSSDGTNMEVVLEDAERYNLYTDPTQSGSGLVPEGDGVIFRLNSDGLPVLGPIEEYYLPTQTVSDLTARFMARNGARDYVLVNQEFHGFFPGDVIYADSVADTGYKKVDRNNIQKALGIVTEVNVPGLDYFSYRPLGRLVNNVNPPLWGQHGDTYYLDPNEPGALTLDKPALNAIPVYFQLDLPTRAIQLERGIEVAQRSESETNKYDVENVASGQTTFTLPSDAKEVLYMAINGIENENFTFDTGSKVLVFDPVETGYGVDIDDEIFFIYKS